MERRSQIQRFNFREVAPQSGALRSGSRRAGLVRIQSARQVKVLRKNLFIFYVGKCNEQKVLGSQIVMEGRASLAQM
jgi:hypothetical protein